MTHDELLAEINRLDSVLTDSYGMSALRAVVELHTRILDAVGRPECLSCRRHYPCPTIQAIEEQLK